ncbi:hypothetical protein BGZ73_007758 [Actinomortierella ambigua]|nr:hypothetical protein BGZ73_007758 [Actinomortierella ambigua]
MAEQTRRALLASEEAIKLHIRRYLSATKRGDWEITFLLKDLFKEYYLNEDSMMDHRMFCEWYSYVFHQYAEESDEAKSLLSVLDSLLLTSPVRSCFLEEAGKTLIKTHLLADAAEDLENSRKQAKTDKTTGGHHNIFSYDPCKAATKQLSRLLSLKLQLAAMAEELETIHKISKSKTIEQMEEIIPTLYKRGASSMEKYIRSAIAYL